jgi:hypothetical protein
MNFNSNKVQKRRGLGTVITTLIILIAAVVMGAGVILFGGSLFQTNTESESITVTNAHLWVNSTAGQGAFVVKNTGGKVLAVESITVRGNTVPFAGWYYNKTTSVVTATNVQTPLTFDTSGGLTSIALASGATMFSQATGPISLAQGETAIIYMNNPGGISSTDSGIAYNLNVKAGKASSVQSISVEST